MLGFAGWRDSAADEDAFYRMGRRKLAAVDWCALLNGELEGIGAVAMSSVS